MSSDLVDDLGTRPPESVTVTVTRRAIPGRDDEMAAWVQAGQRAWWLEGRPAPWRSRRGRPGPARGRA